MLFMSEKPYSQIYIKIYTTTNPHNQKRIEPREVSLFFSKRLWRIVSSSVICLSCNVSTYDVQYISNGLCRTAVRFINILLSTKTFDSKSCQYLLDKLTSSQGNDSGTASFRHKPIAVTGFTSA